MIAALNSTVFKVSWILRWKNALHATGKSSVLSPEAQDLYSRDQVFILPTMPVRTQAKANPRNRLKKKRNPINQRRPIRNCLFLLLNELNPAPQHPGILR